MKRDDGEFTELASACGVRLLHTAYPLTGDWHLAEDLVAPDGIAGHWQAMLLEKNGTTIGAEEFDSTGLFSSATRTVPLLTSGQLAALVENPVWKQLSN